MYKYGHMNHGSDNFRTLAWWVRYRYNGTMKEIIGQIWKITSTGQGPDASSTCVDWRQSPQNGRKKIPNNGQICYDGAVVK
jgi:hypothetical protein